MLILLGLEAVAFFAWALTPEAALRVEVTLIAGLLLTLLIPTALRRGALELAANLVAGGSWIVIIAAFTVAGGVRAPLLHWVGLMPLVAALMGARRSAGSSRSSSPRP